MKAAFLAAAVLATAGVLFYFGTGVHAAKASGLKPGARKALPATAISLPLFFEPNRGQTAPQVKFLAHGAGYGLFLTADEAVLELQRAVGIPHSARSSQRAARSVIRMRLEGANPVALVSGASPLPGKSSYFIGNDPSKWHRDIPQFARVEYQAVYPGVDMVYHGDQGQLEYDFRVAPGAEPNQIALSFTGASARIASGDSGDAGDLILSTANGDVRFHAPRVYQPATPPSRNSSGSSSGNAEKAVAGSFRQLADNKIGFTIGDYDHSRELVIDPTLTYSTYLGGANGSEGCLQGGCVQVAVDSGLNIYLAGVTNSTDFPVTNTSVLTGTQNIFISKINPTPVAGSSVALVYSIYMGSTGTDAPAGIAVDTNYSIYVAGTTTSTCTTTSTSSCFPTTSNAFQTAPTVAGTHGFLTKIGATQTGTPPTIVYNLTYSTYLAGNGTDNVTGLAIDGTNQNAYVTGDTTSSNAYNVGPGFPANANGYQLTSNSPGNPQFFASEINTSYSGSTSMIYSTYFGGGNPAVATAIGGGIAVDPTTSNVNMYITGQTNMLSAGVNGGAGFPLFNAQQACLDQPPGTTSCNLNNTETDAFVAKINPNQYGSNPVYSTYLGGSGTDAGLAIAVDTSGSAYVAGSTNSTDWISPGNGLQPTPGGGYDGFVAKIGALSGSVYPLNYFTYLGGSGADSANAIQVDSNQAAHVTGSTSGNLATVNTLQPGSASSYNGSNYGGGGDAFVALISTSLAGQGAGDYLTYLGGSQLDVGSGIALDIYNATYVAGSTQSPDFPTTAAAYDPTFPGSQGSQAAFVSKIGAVSQLVPTQPNNSPSPSPVAAGTQVVFTFDITNKGPDSASDVTFYAVFPTNELPLLSTNPTAQVTSGTGTCPPISGNTIQCYIPTLAVNAMGTVEVTVTPSDSSTQVLTAVSVSGFASANGGPPQGSIEQTANVVDFMVQALPGYQTVTAGGPASTFTVSFCPTPASLPFGGYSGTITPSQSTSPSMVTSPSPTFTPTPVTLPGNCGTTALSIQTVARPVNTGSLFRRGSFYATWLPIGGLSLVGLGIGAGRKRRRWLIGAVLCLIAGVILVQPGCGGASTSVTTQTGTAAGVYTITITGSAGTGASHTKQVTLRVN